MRVIICLACGLLLVQSLSNAQVRPELIGATTMPTPGPNWFVAKTNNGGYIFDATTGEMQGLISLSGQTSGVKANIARGEFYAPESYYSRGVRGDRSDVVTIYDFDNLSAVAEVDIPEKIAALSFAGHTGLTNNGRFFGVFNMTPAQSISIVDVENRRFVGEISTPGCAMILPVNDNDFMMICGDGTLQLIQLAADGTESNRERTRSFFDVTVDPIFDHPVATRDGWLLISNEGRVLHVTVDGDDIDIGDDWSLLSDEDTEEQWRPGGRQLYTVHKALGFLYILMHQGEQYTHHEPGTEIWVYDIAAERRIFRIEREVAASGLLVTQESEPKLIVGDEEGGLHVYDAVKMKLDRTIEDPGPGASLFVDL